MHPATDVAEQAAAELRAIVDHYAAGEAEVVRAYFRQPHAIEDHLDVLLRQMGRELQTANGLHRALPMFDDLEKGVDRHEFAELLEHIAEETQHYVILADLAEWAADRKLRQEELRRYEVYARWDPQLPDDKRSNALLPEASRMVEVSREAADALGLDLSTEVGRLSEGGGGGAFLECARLEGDEFRDRLAVAMRRILVDEIHHGPDRIEGFARSRIHTGVELATAARWLTTIMAQHLRVRNEIWRNPLSIERMAAIDRGEVTPLDREP